MSSAPAPRLARRLGLADAVFIGLGAMIGAGVFSAFGPAALAVVGGAPADAATDAGAGPLSGAGLWLMVALAVAAVVALCNATSSAQLAAVYPSAGGTYVYGRERLGAWWGFAAGWSFVIGKTASCAAMALTFAAYAVPEAWAWPVAALAVAALVLVNCFGVTRTATVARVIVVGALGVLAVVVASGAAGPNGAKGWGAAGSAAAGWFGLTAPGGSGGATAYGVLQAAGLLFFAFAGYARIATLGEEVKNPAKTIPRAIVLAFAVAVVVYAAVALTVLGALGPAGLAASANPLSETVAANGWSWAVPLVTIGASLASLGALLALIAGVGRTSLAMAREGDLPRWLAAVHPRYSVPHRAELALGAVVVVLVLTVDLRGAIGFSSFGVLLYYLVANIAALTQPRAQRRYWRVLAVLGGAGCVVLVVTLPLSAVVVGILVVLIGFAGRAVVLRRRGRRP